jgi:hypothetical protein
MPETCEPPECPAADMLHGASAIAEFLFGDRKYRKRVFYLCERGRLPVYRLGTGGLWARKSTLIAYIEAQEKKVMEEKKS